MSKAPRRALSTPSPHDPEIADTTSGLGKAGLNAAETAQYIAEFTAELSYLARRTRLDLLAYLLDMARLEASRAIRSERRDR